MEDVLFGVIAVLGSFVLLASIWGLFVGIFALVSDQQLQRCRRCGRYGLAPRGRLHAASCPTVPAHHPLHPWAPTLRLHHH